MVSLPYLLPTASLPKVFVRQALLQVSRQTIASAVFYITLTSRYFNEFLLSLSFSNCSSCIRSRGRFPFSLLSGSSDFG